MLAIKEDGSVFYSIQPTFHLSDRLFCCGFDAGYRWRVCSRESVPHARIGALSNSTFTYQMVLRR